jgi:Rps23 Pro-64 3,4-dihydroxylase Tpa1-like proline 4-hydroxylase
MYNLIDFRQYFIDKYYRDDWIYPARERYNNAQPFPHIVIDDFLPKEVLDAAVDSFDQYDSNNWLSFSNQNELKLASKDEVFIPQVIRSILHELNSGFVLNWLSFLTNTPRLVADTRLYGGGMHRIENGGKLSVHIDFNVENRTGLYRQLNLLLYLNKEWKDEYNGHLELWNTDKTKCESKISPIFNRCVIFNTTGRSWHGHPTPLNAPAGVARKSLALYYYNVSDQTAFDASIQAHTTLWSPT